MAQSTRPDATVPQHVVAQDLYAYLSASQTATAADLKNAFRLKILQLHPDRQQQPQRVLETDDDDVGITEINLAWEVLRNDETRALYDQLRKVYLANQRSNPASNSSAFAHSISLDLFTPHYLSRPEDDDLDDAPSRDDDEDREPDYYTYPCRCSSQFKITLAELEASVSVVGCEGCSERCRVEYEEVVE